MRPEDFWPAIVAITCTIVIIVIVLVLAVFEP